MMKRRVEDSVGGFWKYRSPYPVQQVALVHTSQIGAVLVIGVSSRFWTEWRPPNVMLSTWTRLEGRHAHLRLHRHRYPMTVDETVVTTWFQEFLQRSPKDSIALILAVEV
jgi:hypothetical protein